MKNEKILSTGSTKDATIEILQLTKLEGAKTSYQATQLFYLQETNTTMKMVRIKLNGGKVVTEAGALYYSKGKITNSVPTGGIIGKLIKGALTKEAAFNPEYSGYGEIVLEPSFGHYILVELTNETIICDKGAFYCSIGDIKTSIANQSNISSAFLGNEGFFQTKISGTGWVVLEIPVPMTEIECMDIKDETVQVDGNFAILRSADIVFTVEKSTKKLTGTVLGGEGFLSTFRGSGMLWLAPTAPVYKKMDYGIDNIKNKNMNNNS